MSGDEVIERVVVQDPGDGITDRTHHVLYRTLRVFGIGAVSTFLIGGLTHASDGGEGAIQNTNHLTEGNLSRGLNECIATLRSSATREKPCSFQCQEDLFKKFNRNMLASRDLMALECRLAMHEGKLKQMHEVRTRFFSTAS